MSQILFATRKIELNLMSNLKQTPKPSRGKPSQARSWSRSQKPKQNRNKIYNFKTLPSAVVLP